MSQSSPKIPLRTAVAIVVANMVGTGVFTSLGFQVAAIPSGFPVLLLWVAGGIISLCGAFAYAELTAMMPRSGGEYHLLGKIWHPVLGFLSGWVALTVGFAAPVAAAAIAFGEYLEQVMQTGSAIRSAILVVLLIALIHLAGMMVASRFQVIFTAGKVLLIIFLAACAFLLGEPQNLSFLPVAGDGELIFSGSFAISLFFVMYSYSGWNAAAYVAGEVENPARNVPIALVLGTGIVSVLYVALNAGFLWSTPIPDMVGESGYGREDVGNVAAQAIFGERGGRFIGLLICFGLLSTMSAMMWAGPRVTRVMGEDYRLFRFLSRTDCRGAPVPAILLQTGIVILIVSFFSFEQIIYYIEAILILSSLLTVMGVFILRFRQPEMERPYKTWGYPFTPILFCGFSVYMLIAFIRMRPEEALTGLLTILIGLGVYALSVWSNRWKKAP